MHCYRKLFSLSIEERSLDNLTLSEIFIFFTGSDSIPPGRFNTELFNCTSCFPTASTCLMQLTLPTIIYWDDYSIFKMETAYGFQNHLDSIDIIPFISLP